MSFLKAKWENLLLVNYLVEPALLEPLVPPKTELDLWQDKCYVSLIGFMFNQTSVLGLPLPFHQSFEEVNLRFYVQHRHNNQNRHGVVFIKEIVPKAMISFFANTLYNENYITKPMRHVFGPSGDSIKVEYGWKLGNVWQTMSAKVSLELDEIASGSETEFITKHFWGYAQKDQSSSFEYEVKRPEWKSRAVISSDVNVDFGKTYGSQFGHLTTETPTSVMFADGSAIEVSNKRRI